MREDLQLKPPFFEIGPKSYLYGDDVVALARAADAAAKKYDVDIIFTAPIVELRRVAEATERILVFAPHMDPIYPGGRGWSCDNRMRKQRCGSGCGRAS